MCSLPKVLLVGSPDVDARLELMHCLKDAFNFSAFGSDPTLHDRLLAEGFCYSTHNLSRRANPVLDLLTLGQLVLIFQFKQKLYELTLRGRVVATRDLSELDISELQGMVFAPSGDLTDDPLEVSLYIADSGPGALQG